MSDQAIPVPANKPIDRRDFVLGWMSVFCLCLATLFGWLMMHGIGGQLSSFALLASTLTGAFVGVLGVLRAKHHSPPAWVACCFNLFILVFWVLHHLVGLA